MSLAVIIPSRNAGNLAACSAAVRTLDPDVEIIAIDDGLSAIPRDVIRLPGRKPFVFARNCNIGIEFAGGDVVLLNDDAVLSEGSFEAMQRAAHEHPEYGVISAACPTASIPQRPQGAGLRAVDRMVAFFAVLIPRRTIDAVGLLDERFTGYGHEDDDYCLRVRRAGLKVGVFDGCVVEHGSLKSTFRTNVNIWEQFRVGRSIFRMKWGADAELV